ncbi:MAG: Gfo/Idh/MocA family oxidoreductase [Chloroflexi bacterium]|nr:Gfo/Idh/MocA family oxidoreductase [Chloroflexota bacterium]
MQRLGVAVIGTGSMGRRHAENVCRTPELYLDSIVDVRPEVAQHVAAELGCSFWSTSAEEALARPSCHAAVIATTANTHPDIITLAARYHRDILCEKPLALTEALAQHCITTAHDAGIRLQVGFMRRYDPSYVQAYAALRRGDLGTPLLFHAIARDRLPGPATPNALAIHGGIFLDSAIHDFDLARWLMQTEVAAVSAQAARLPRPSGATPELPNAATIQLRFSGGAIGVTEVFDHALYGYDIRTEVIGSAGSAQIGLPSSPYALSLLTAQSHQQHCFRDYLERFATAYELELRDWAQRMLGDQPPAVTGEDGLAALRIAIAARTAAETQTTVHLS